MYLLKLPEYFSNILLVFRHGNDYNPTAAEILFLWARNFLWLCQEITFHVKMGLIKDRNGMDLTEAEDIKRWQEYTEELYKKDLHD